MINQVPVSSQTQYQQQAHQTMSGRPMDERITSLEVRVGGIEEGIRHIVSKLDSRDKMPWGALIGTGGFIVTLVGAIGGLAFTPLNAGINDVKTNMVKFENRTESFMKREDIESQINGLRAAVGEKFTVGTERRNDLQAKTDDRISRSEKDLASIQSNLVPRAEHEQQWRKQERDFDLLRNRLDQVETRTEKRGDALEKQIEKFGSETLSKSEALSRNEAQDKLNGLIRREIDEHMRTFNDRQQRTIDRLESGRTR